MTGAKNWGGGGNLLNRPKTRTGFTTKCCDGGLGFQIKSVGKNQEQSSSGKECFCEKKRVKEKLGSLGGSKKIALEPFDSRT